MQIRAMRKLGVMPFSIHPGAADVKAWIWTTGGEGAAP